MMAAKSKADEEVRRNAAQQDDTYDGGDSTEDDFDCEDYSPATPPDNGTPIEPASIMSPYDGLQLLSKIASPLLKQQKMDELTRKRSGDSSDASRRRRKSADNGGGRKDKSLCLLSENFLKLYETGDEQEICLDAVAKELDVTRRRIYDVVNVLEGVGVVTRKAKNRYTWCGMSGIDTTLEKLKTLANKELVAGGGDSSLQSPQGAGSVLNDSDLTCTPLLSHTNTGSIASLTPLSSKDSKPLANSLPEDTPLTGTALVRPPLVKADSRTDRSLGVLAQKFLMLFLKRKQCNKSTELLLEDAAEELIFIDTPEEQKQKTKVRRLYDIANILCSLRLIEKINLSDSGVRKTQHGRKPAFRWIGKDLDCVQPHPLVSGRSKERRRSRTQSLLDPLESPKDQGPKRTGRRGKNKGEDGDEGEDGALTKSCRRNIMPKAAGAQTALPFKFEAFSPLQDMHHNRPGHDESDAAAAVMLTCISVPPTPTSATTTTTATTATTSSTPTSTSTPNLNSTSASTPFSTPAFSYMPTPPASAAASLTFTTPNMMPSPSPASMSSASSNSSSSSTTSMMMMSNPMLSSRVSPRQKKYVTYTS